MNYDHASINQRPLLQKSYAMSIKVTAWYLDISTLDDYMLLAMLNRVPAV